METQSTSATTESTLPTGDIKVFIDAFNKDFDDLIKKSTDNQNNLKNIYADAIKISTPRTGTWPKDENVKTIGDLFKYTFPDVTTTTFIQPPSGVTGDVFNNYVDSEKIEDKKSWDKDFKSTPIIKEFFDKIKSGVTFANKTLSGYQDLKKPGITNPSLWSPGQFYFDIFMEYILDDNGPLKRPGNNNGGDALNYKQGRDFLKLNGGYASVSNFEPSGLQEISLLGSTSSNTPFDYFQFNDILSGGSSYDSIKNLMLYNTGINIGGFDLRYQSGDIDVSVPNSFPSLRVQYTSGLLSELKKDTKFTYRGEITNTSGEQVSVFESKSIDITGFNFTGAYEHILLYKAFIQAGDNYKSVVLPYRIPEQPESLVTTQIPLVKVESPTANNEVQFKFNVEKKDTFIVVGGAVSPPPEFIIVANDGVEYIFDNFNNDELGEEYTEGEYMGTEDDLFKVELGEALPDVDVDSLNDLKGFDPNNPNETLSTDSTSKYPVSKDKDANARSIIKAAKSMGVTNKYTIAAILAIVSKESGFVPRSEVSYSGTSGARIAKIFGRRGYTDEQWDVIKKDPARFFNIVYGGKYSNNTTGDGYKYRGRGFNQITFKGNYELYAKETGLNIVNDPDLLNKVDVASKCLIAYFQRNFRKAPSDLRAKYNFSDINSFKNLNDATGAIYHANAGWGKSYSAVVADSTGGRKKAFNNSGPLFNTYKDVIG